MGVEEKMTVFVALEAEQKPLQRRAAGLPVHQFGPGYENGLRAALSCEKGRLIGNIGLSGGLASQLESGDLVLARKVLGYNRQGGQVCYETDREVTDHLAAKLATRGFRMHEGPLACVADPVLTAGAKAELGLRTGALAVDMESAAMAKAAQELHTPFFCLRVICDPQHRPLKEKLLVGADDRGNNRPGRLARCLLRHPWLLFPFLAMLRDYNRAASTLTRLGAILASDFFKEGK